MLKRTKHSDRLFFSGLIGLAFFYFGLIILLLIADIGFVLFRGDFKLWQSLLSDRSIHASIRLTLFTCTVTALLSLLVAVPAGYLLSRYEFTGKSIASVVFDIPIVLPPLVVGLSLIILFNQFPFPDRSFDSLLGNQITYQVPAVILAQFTVACAFAVRMMRNTFEHIDPRIEQVAQTLGCSRGRAFFSVVLPQAWPGAMSAATLAWARAMGEFGPILVFAGMIRGKTEVLSSTVYLELSTGNLEVAVFVSLLMVLIAIVVLLLVRRWEGRIR